MGEPIEADLVFELLAGLVARSLVVAERDRPETRYRLLETIREYGEERLAEHEETEILRARHAEYYTELAAMLSADMRGPHQMEAGRRLLAEHENLLAAMNHAIDTDNVDVALRLLRAATGTAGAQVGYELRLPVDPILELTGAFEHPLYPYGLAFAAIRTAQRGDLEAAETLCEQALDAQQRLGADDLELLIDVFVTATRAAIVYVSGAVHDAAVHLDRNLELVRPTGDLAWIASVLYGAATFHAMAGDSRRGHTTRHGRPRPRSSRRASPPHHLEPCRARRRARRAGPRAGRALLRESIQLRASLEYENWAELTQAVLISARLNDWPLTLELASPSIRHLHWTGNRPLLAATFNLVARAVTPTAADSAAVLQGAARSMTPAPPPAAPTTTGPTSDASQARPPGPASFVAELRRETTGLLRDALGEQRLHVLRAEGETMSTDDAVAYALNAITHAELDHDT